jgi:intracellular sulfur oxidation DsrE/DsrF family protein
MQNWRCALKALIMKHNLLFSSFIIFLSTLAFTSKAQTPANPIIKDYGTIYGLDNVTMPDKSLEYKIVIDLKPSNKDYQQVNPGLITIARMLNLHGVASIPKEQLHVVAVLHYTATPIVLNNVGYQKKYGVDNPNLDIIRQLKEAGVDFYICGQSLVARKYAFENVNPYITIALSMLTVVSEHTMKGYSLLVVQ